MKTTNLIFLIVTLGLIGAPLIAASQELKSGAYYVSPLGDDSNDGRLVEDGGSGPWRTIQHAAQKVIAGDTVYVREGVYTEPAPLEGSTKYWGIRPANDGAASLPITYAAYPGDRVVIDMKDQAPCFTLYGRQYITIEGFELTNCVQGGVWIMSGSGRENSNIRVIGNIIHNIDGGTGNNVAGVRIDDAGYSLISDNTIYNIRVGGVDNANAAGVLSYGMYETTIQNNNISDAYSGVFHKIPDVNGRKGGVFKKNVIHDVKLAFYFNNNDGVPESTIHYNTELVQNIVYNTTAFLYETTHIAYGQSRGLKIYNNTVVGADVGVRGFADVEIKNNIFYNFPGLITVYQPDALTDAKVHYPSIALSDYNVFYPEFSGAVGVYSGNETRAYSLLEWQGIGYGGDPLTIDVPAPGPDSHSTTSDPLFVDVANNNYHLSDQSPARNMSSEGGAVGAYITGTEIIGVRNAPTTIARPNAPQLLVE